MSTRVVVSGAAGRLGARIVAAIEADASLALAKALTRADVAEDAIVAGTVLVECAPHSAAVQHIELAASCNVPCVLASTGLSTEQRHSVERAALSTAVVVAPNLSIGVTVLLDLVERASSALAHYDLELFEIHHRRKRDAPSGTAWALAEAAARGRGGDAEREAILARAGDVGPRGDREIGIQTLRGGDVVGEHTVMFIGETERLELTHRAASRDVFAAGALHAVKFLAAGREPGVYSMKDVLGL